MDGDLDASKSQEPSHMLTLYEPKEVQMAKSLRSQGSALTKPADSGSSSPISDKRKDSVESKKRKARHENIPKSRLKRLRGFYNSDYRNLLNDTISEAITTTHSDDLEPLSESQIGITIWSPKEKEVLFSALSTKGRNDLLGIAGMIGTKTQLEVRVYLKLLQQATKEHLLYDRRPQFLGVADIPRALEVSQNCCNALDLAAGALDVLHEKEERDSEAEKLGKFGLLDAKSAEWIEDHLHKSDGDENEASQIPIVARILILRSFLGLSAHLFMNSSDPEYNWRSYVGRRDTPRILYSAFSDIHDLTISVTRRLVQSSLFFAMSRLKAVNATNYKHGQHVKRKDVTAALDVLGMKSNADAYWAGLAKRCNLDVYENIRRKSVKGKKLSYGEVERRLNQHHKCNTISGVTTPQKNDPPSQGSVNDNNISMSDYPSEDITDATTSSYDSDLSHRSNKIHSRAQAHLEQEYDDYVEALDLRASQYEEQRLWTMLRHESTGDTKSEEAELPKKLASRRRDKEDLDDWRSRAEYVGEWEAYRTPISADDFAADRKKFRNNRPFPPSVQRGRTSSLAQESDDDDTYSGDQSIAENGERSDLSGESHQRFPATNAKNGSEEVADTSDDQMEDSDGGSLSAAKDRIGEVEERQETSSSDSDSGFPAREADEQNNVNSSTQEQETLDGRDGGSDNGLESNVNSSTDG